MSEVRDKDQLHQPAGTQSAKSLDINSVKDFIISVICVKSSVLFCTSCFTFM